MRLTYPKIDTLFNRNKKFKVIEGDFTHLEFELVKTWSCTEKIHGENMRIIYDGKAEIVSILTREHDKPEYVQKELLKFMQEKYTFEKLRAIFKPKGVDHAVLFGEGYGPRIQQGKGYKNEHDIILFDVLVNDILTEDEWWLEPESIQDIATKLETEVVPDLGFLTVDTIVEMVKKGFPSLLAKRNTGADLKSEGIIARTVPGLLFRNGKRLMFKLKTKDFAG